MSVTLSSQLLCFFVAFFAATAAPPPPALTVAAASDLSSVGPQIETLYNQQVKSGGLRLVFSGSGALRQQIEASAPFDVFLSANASYVDQLAASGKIIPQSIVSYAQGRVGILWRDGKKHPIRDLTTLPIRFVALPNPKLAPYGLAAQQALEYGGLWGMVQNKVVYAENVRQALQLEESGNADAVLTAYSLLQGTNAELIPAEWHKPIIQKGGVVAASSQQKAAKQFLQFLLGKPAQALLAQYGFTAPEH